MILLFTDFGVQGPYVGQMKSVIAQIAPAEPVIDLMHDAPAFRPDLAGLLLAALVPYLPAGAVIVAVVDPGVGSDRPALRLEADGRCFIGPGNGLLAPIAQHAHTTRLYSLPQPDRPISASFHGRDLFAPAAAAYALGQAREDPPASAHRLGPLPSAEDRAQIVYVDGYGNAMTGLSANSFGHEPALIVGGTTLPRHRTFHDAAPGQAFWYENSLGLAEIAVREGSAAARFALAPGSPVHIATGSGPGLAK